MEKKPTVIGAGGPSGPPASPPAAPVAAAPVATAAPAATATPLDATLASLNIAPASTTLPVAADDPLANFPVALESSELAAVRQKAQSVSITGITLQQIAVLEIAPEQALNKVLDAILANIDIFDNPQLFQLVKKLGEVVDAEKLPDLAQRILNHKETFGEKALKFLKSEKARQNAIERFWEETQGMVKGTSAKLTKVIGDMELQVQKESTKLISEIQTLDQLNENYKKLFRDFAVSVAFLQVFLSEAKAELAQMEQTANPNDQVQQASLLELRDKVQALESRALALEGSMTRLPASSMVNRQLQAAGISTLQEVTTTSLSRFASIKQTIVTLNAAMVTKGVQNVAAAGKALDENLLGVQNMLMKDVVTTAANAPGENRVDQANMISQIVEQTGELMQIVDAAQETNKQKFGQARSMYDGARKEMLALGKKRAALTA